MTDLCELARKWGTDKAIYYTPFYSQIFSERRMEIRKMIELGIGYPGTMLDSVCRMGLDSYTTGASLFMWEEYFPNAEIWALDRNREIFIDRGRIHSAFVDQDKPETFQALSIGTDFDFIIEDGWHTLECQRTAAFGLMPLLKKTGIYIIEDVGSWWKELERSLPWETYTKEFGPARVTVVLP